MNKLNKNLQSFLLHMDEELNIDDDLAKKINLQTCSYINIYNTCKNNKLSSYVYIYKVLKSNF